MIDNLLELGYAAMTSPWIYVAVFLFAAIDAFFPLVPSETLVIAAGAFAVTGEPNAILVVAAAATGAFAGDHVSYGIGRKAGDRIIGRARGRRGRAAWDWARRMIARRGGPLLVVARYVPGGRTATTLTMGAVSHPLRSFAAWDAVAALTWGVYSTLLGYLGGAAFHDEPLKGVLVGIGLGLAVTAAIEVIRWRRAAHRSGENRSVRRDDSAERADREEAGARHDNAPRQDARVAGTS